MINLEIEKSDIKKIGTTIYSENNNSGNTIFICELNTANIEEILLRNLLKIFGDYSIIETNDWIWNDSGYIDSIQFITNLPWEEYTKL